MGAAELCDAEGVMCRNIKTLHKFAPPATVRHRAAVAS